jgi:CheY-like chemotaxis protein
MKCLVLVVEDDRDIRDTIAEVLRDEGYRVHLAANGSEALEFLRGGTLPNLILLDLMMPVMSGWDFRSEQRKDGRLAAIPTVILSGDSGVRDKARALEVEAAIAKPLGLDQLLQVVDQFC